MEHVPPRDAARKAGPTRALPNQRMESGRMRLTRLAGLAALCCGLTASQAMAQRPSNLMEALAPPTPVAQVYDDQYVGDDGQVAQVNHTEYEIAASCGCAGGCDSCDSCGGCGEVDCGCPGGSGIFTDGLGCLTDCDHGDPCRIFGTTVTSRSVAGLSGVTTLRTSPCSTAASTTSSFIRVGSTPRTN